MRRRLSSFLVLAFLLSGTARGETPVRPEKDVGTLCAAGERAVFSCPSGKKTISVCASPDLSATAGYLRYRYGRSKQKVELAYPADEGNPRQHFRFHREDGAKSSAEQLSFSIGAFTYIVFVERAAFDFNGSGVLVRSGGKPVAHLKCDHVRPVPDRLYDLDGLGLPAAQYEDVGHSS